jgi:hypothetical protein
MDTVEELFSKLSEADAAKLLARISPKKASASKPAKKIPFPKMQGYSDVVGPQLCISLKKAKMFMCETLIPNMDLRSTASIKAQFVEGMTTLAELMDDPKLKDNLLKTAAKGVMMDRDALIKYIAAVVSNI